MIVARGGKAAKEILHKEREPEAEDKIISETTVDIFVTGGAVSGLSNKSRDTPLGIAARWGRLEAAEMLI